MRKKRTIKLKIKDKKAFELAYKKFKRANLMSDNKFRQIAKVKEAIQEILRVLLRDKKLKVIEAKGQRDYSEAIFHGVVLDCEAKLGTGEIVNIEIQNLFTDDPFWRNSYIQSILRVENAPKQAVFRSQEQRRIISIMFCAKDVIGSGEAFSQLVLIDKKSKKIIDNGIDQYYIYVLGNTEDEKLKELLKMFVDTDYTNLDMFPNLSKAKVNANNLEKGEYMLLYGEDLRTYEKGEKAGLKRGREEGEARGIKKGEANAVKNMLKFVKKLIKDGKLTEEEAYSAYETFGISKSKLEGALTLA